MNTISWEIILKRIKKRKGWIAVGNTLIISGFLSFNNHLGWGIWCSTIGFVITMICLLKK